MIPDSLIIVYSNKKKITKPSSNPQDLSSKELLVNTRGLHQLLQLNKALI